MLDLGDWGTVGKLSVVVLPHACFRAFLVLPGARILLLMQGVQASYGEYTALLKSWKVQNYRDTIVWLVEL